MGSNYLADAYSGLGMAVGAQALGPERVAARAEARAKAQQSNEELKRMKATQPTEQDYKTMSEAQSTALDNALLQQKQMQSQLQERASYEAIRTYGYDPDPRHLNVMINDQKKSGNSIFKDVVRFDEITETDRDMMQEHGLDPDFVLGNEDLRRNYLKVTKPDGSQEIRSLDTFKAATRYNQYATKEDIDSQKDRIMLTQVKALGYEGTELGVEAFRRAVDETGSPDAAGFQDAYTKHYDQLRASGYSRHGSSGGRSGGSSGGKSGGGNMTEAEAEADRRTRLQGLQPGSAGYDKALSENMSKVKTEFGRTSGMRNNEDSDAASEELTALGFWDSEPTDDPKVRMQFEPLIRRIEKGSNAELTAAQQVTLSRVNELTHLGDLSKDITPEETGLIDRVFRNVSKYISDNTDGIAQESAYAAFRNTVRHALYGSVLTPNETHTFVEQFGELGQQRGPVLAQLRTGLEQVKSDYEVLARTGHPAVIKHRAGMTETQLHDVIQGLDDRIEMIDNTMMGKPVAQPQVNRPSQETVDKVDPNLVLTPDKRSRLDALRTGGQPQ